LPLYVLIDYFMNELYVDGMCLCLSVFVCLYLSLVLHGRCVVVCDTYPVCYMASVLHVVCDTYPMFVCRYVCASHTKIPKPHKDTQATERLFEDAPPGILR